jgi:hypothetical protein
MIFRYRKALQEFTEKLKQLRREIDLYYLKIYVLKQLENLKI